MEVVIAWVLPLERRYRPLKARYPGLEAEKKVRDAWWDASRTGKERFTLNGRTSWLPPSVAWGEAGRARGYPCRVVRAAT